MALVDGASVDSFSLETNTARLPLVTSTKYSAPRSPLSSRWTKETFVPSGLHLIDSGARPRMPASLKIDSMVSCLAPCTSCAGDLASVWANANSAEKRQRIGAAECTFTFFSEDENWMMGKFISRANPAAKRGLSNGPRVRRKFPHARIQQV